MITTFRVLVLEDCLKMTTKGSTRRLVTVWKKVALTMSVQQVFRLCSRMAPSRPERHHLTFEKGSKSLLISSTSNAGGGPEWSLMLRVVCRPRILELVVVKRNPAHNATASPTVIDTHRAGTHALMIKWTSRAMSERAELVASLGGCFS